MTEKEKSKLTSRKKQYSAPALEKGLDILELLSFEPEGLSIGEITLKLDKSVGELFRMLAVLEQRGYIELPSGSDKYTLTLKMFGLANRFPPVKRLTAIASASMQKLTYDIEQSCHLVIYFQGRGHVVVQLDSPSERMFSVRLGAEAPLMNTCSGHILLAFAEKHNFETMLKKIPSNHPKPTIKGFQPIIDRVLSQGFESIKSAQAQGIQDIGYPVFDNSSQVIAVLVVPFVEYLNESCSMDITEAQLKIAKTASEISNRLGYEKTTMQL
jgi:DNA-binding IclR family transcriptional regulator